MRTFTYVEGWSGWVDTALMRVYHPCCTVVTCYTADNLEYCPVRFAE